MYACTLIFCHPNPSTFNTTTPKVLESFTAPDKIDRCQEIALAFLNTVCYDANQIKPPPIARKENKTKHNLFVFLSLPSSSLIIHINPYEYLMHYTFHISLASSIDRTFFNHKPEQYFLHYGQQPGQRLHGLARGLLPPHHSTSFEPMAKEIV